MWLPNRKIISSDLSRRESLLVLLGGLGLAARAQAPGSTSSTTAASTETSPSNSTSTPTFATGVKVVNVPVSVRDKQGKPIIKLTQADFELKEDGRKQEIRYFARQTDTPVTLGLLMDTSFSQRRVLGQERSAGKDFLKAVLRPERDAAFVIGFDVEVELTQDATSALKPLESALDDLELPDEARQRRARGVGRRPGGGGFGAGIGTLLFDAVFLAADEVLRTRTGRKAMIVLSDGVDAGSKVSIARAIEMAQRADSAIYAIHIADSDEQLSFGPRVSFPGGGFPGGGRRGRMGRAGAGRPGRESMRQRGERVLQRMAEETGGQYIDAMGDARDKKSLHEAFREIEEELRNQYDIGYVSDNARAAGEYRAITVSANQKDAVIRARKGYYAMP